MKFSLDNIQRKEGAAYKTIYLHQRQIDQIKKIAVENKASFNAIVASMIEQCLKDYESHPQTSDPGA